MPTPRSKSAPPRPPPLLLDPARLPVWLWAPNLIGYLRVAALALAVAQPDPGSPLSVRLLFLSFALDYFDGPVARKLNMCSQFGDMLDHATDHATMAWLVFVSSDWRVNVWVNLVANLAVPFAYMLYHGHYFKHAAGGNWVTRAVEENNYWNLPSLLWAANCIIVPMVKLSFHAQRGLDAKASTELVDFADALGLCVTVAYSVAVWLPERAAPSRR
jgi:phosphatidylglycerophosphate synthase